MAENITPAIEFIARRLSAGSGRNPIATAEAMADMVTADNYLGGSEEIGAVQQALEAAGPYGEAILRATAEQRAEEERQSRLNTRMKRAGMSVVK